MKTVVAGMPFQKYLVAEMGISDGTQPILSVAIPHYNHRRHLEVVIDSLVQQNFDDFEIVVSDDASPDDSVQIIPGVLKRTGRRFRYYAHPANLGYDGNVRFCLAASLGRYVMLLGNDDAIAAPDTLGELVESLQLLQYPEVAFTNYEDWSGSGPVVRRALATGILGEGPFAAARFFRSFSFVSGVIFERASATRHETDRWDNSIYYQIYLACRVLAAGGRLGCLALSAVRKDIRVDGEPVPNYASKWRAAPWSFQSRHTGLDSVLRVAADAVLPYVPLGQRSAVIRRMATQVLAVQYPFWLLEYRRVANWSFAVGVARSMRPGYFGSEYRLDARDRALLWALYGAATVGGLLAPLGLFKRMQRGLSEAVRWSQQGDSLRQRG